MNPLCKLPDGATNPILPAYCADPSLVQHEGRYYLYATLDPWGQEFLGCWESGDFVNWTFHALNWPTKTACTSLTSVPTSNVWAPSVVQAVDGSFVMYISVGSEIWVGRAPHPLGPWQDAHEGRPLIPADYFPGFHMIDAEAFLDEDGTPYLYWGSGWDWKDGRCYAVKLAPDMVSFHREDIVDVTPAETYFEAPFMLKHQGRYYLMYSNGNTTLDTYQVHYAVGHHPLGPFLEPEQSPVLVTDQERGVLSPGHHAVFAQNGRHFMLYHRHSVPFDPEFIGRQICVNEMHFTPGGEIAAVVPDHHGPRVTEPCGERGTPFQAVASASSILAGHADAARVLDGCNATRWAAAAEDAQPILQLELAAGTFLTHTELLMEFPWKRYFFRLEAGVEGQAWESVADYRAEGIQGSPLVIPIERAASRLRLVFASPSVGTSASLFQWRVFAQGQ